MLLRTHKPYEAVAVWRDLLKVNPHFPPTLVQMAWVLSAIPDDKLRNGAEAVKLAEHAVQLTRGQDGSAWDVLSIAYAETGQFAKAMEAAEHALMTSNNPGMRDVIRARMDGYRVGVPFRDPSLLPKTDQPPPQI